MQGSLSASENEQLSNDLLRFAEKELDKIDTPNDAVIQNISKKLSEYFIKPN